MNISPELMYAILAMDSYNQGYGAGIEHGKTDIGRATVTPRDENTTDDEYDAWQDAGFYAAAYTYDGGTVISYRGTDFFPTEDLLDDARHGWSMGGGNYTALQTPLSVDFLDAVKQQAGNSNITLTGHSLGGGLAGFNSRLFDVEAVVFDPSPFLDATQNVLDYLIRDESLLDPFNPVFIFDLDGLGENKGSSKVGNATVSYTIADAGLSDEAQAAGFYAIAYDTNFGTVISYRGTDFAPDPGTANDIADGWPIGAGNFFEPQALLSVDFLDAVQPDSQKGSVILTGHSLGGGLAGFNSRLFGNEAGWVQLIDATHSLNFSAGV